MATDMAARNAELYRLIVTERWPTSHAAARLGITRERARQILVQKYGITPRQFQLERMERNAMLKFIQPRWCQFCGEDYHAEGWKNHQKRLRHNYNPGHEARAMRDAQIVADYIAKKPDGTWLYRVIDIERRHGVAAAVIMRQVHQAGHPNRKPTMGRKTKTNFESRVLTEAVRTMLEAGLPNEAIAATLKISRSMVYLYRQQFFGKTPPAEVARAQSVRMKERWEKYWRGEGPRPGGRKRG